jgi:2-keto-4-pentenoate hydratase/2-oxohepta-3-ene-1,7-dioic acid hydratase in catechol pathway
VFCVGKNYRAHAQEFARSGFDSSSTVSTEDIPALPIFFTKAPESVIATGEPIRYPHGVSKSLDYEAELAVVLGKGGRGIEKSAAMSHVFGYTIVNDVTARDLQAAHKQWFLGKSLDTFCPMGPYLVTADELRGEEVEVRCWVNGELRQSANTRDLIFDIPTLIATLSAGLTLFPGDIIATGTPAGVGIGFSPPRFLAVGDLVTLEVQGIGRLENIIA